MTHRSSRLLMLWLLILTANAWAGEPLVPLFDKIVSAYGATRPPAMRETGSMTSFRKGNAPLVRLYRAPNHFRIAIGYASGAEVRTMIGAQAWQQDEPASPELRAAIALQKERVALPWNMLAEKAVRDLGTVVDANGKTLRAIEVPVEQNLKMIVDIDPETGHILRCRGKQAVGNGNTLEFTSVYSNFHTQNGRVHALTEQHYIMGQLIGQSTIDTVDYPSTLPDEAFTPPASVRKEI